MVQFTYVHSYTVCVQLYTLIICIHAYSVSLVNAPGVATTISRIKSSKYFVPKNNATVCYILTDNAILLLNQVHADLQPAHAWFLKITSVHERLYTCVCVYHQGYYYLIE